MREPLDPQGFLDKEIEYGITPDNPAYYTLMSAASDLVAKYSKGLVVEIGAGVGTLGEVLISKGIDYYGIDPSLPHRNFAAKRGVKLHDITGYPTKCSVVVSIEVFEHMTDEQVHDYLKVLKADFFIFSSTSHRTENDVYWGHINVKEQAEWIYIFNHYGWVLIDEPKCPTEWTKVFKYEG